MKKTTALIELGKGRSGTVFQGQDDNKIIAKKVFTGDFLTNLVHYVFSGAPNPYIWNKDAILCAFYRRSILKKLVNYWFGDQLRVAAAYKFAWNSEFLAYELDTEFIDGRTVSLHSPFVRNKEQKYLAKEIMKPLQKHLVEAGCDGLAWQAGKSNPVAANNFLVDEKADDLKMVWIDLESGVPALIPINPWAFFSFYLPKSIKHRRALFDDIDISKLRDYLRAHKQALTEKFGDKGYDSLRGEVDNLGTHQNNWKSVPRVERSITYQLKKQKLTQHQANRYLRFPFLWYPREIARISLKAITKIWPLLQVIYAFLIKVPYKKICEKIWLFIRFQEQRELFAKKYVNRRIDSWAKRDQISSKQEQLLKQQLEKEVDSSYISDFGVHIAIKPIVKFIEYVIGLTLYALGVIDTVTFVILLLTGPLVRTVYTLWRLSQASVKGQEKPWVALFVGIFPVVGTGAYPAQMLYSATKDKKVSEFIIYDISTQIGKYFPIWGGKDTLTEHFFNRLPNVLIADKSR